MPHALDGAVAVGGTGVGHCDLNASSATSAEAAMKWVLLACRILSYCPLNDRSVRYCVLVCMARARVGKSRVAAGCARAVYFEFGAFPSLSVGFYCRKFTITRARAAATAAATAATAHGAYDCV